MAYINSTNNKGFFVNTTRVFDVQRLQEVNVNSDDFKELLVLLHQDINSIQLAVNARDNGLRLTEETLTNKQWFPLVTGVNVPNRFSYNIVINFGALPNTSTKSVAHNINTSNGIIWAQITGAATNTSNNEGIPIPYSDTSADVVQIEVDSTNVNITTNADFSAFDTCYILLEYLR